MTQKSTHISIKYRLTLIIAIAIAIVVSSVSILYFFEFKNNLDERILLQLTSIKRLKRLQIEDHLKEEWDELTTHGNDCGQEITQHPISDIRKLYPTLPEPFIEGIYDISDLDSSKLRIAYIHQRGDSCLIKTSHCSKIKSILNERTGMGASGETYIISMDGTMRSASRFFPEDTALNIQVDTYGADQIKKDIEGTSIYLDYRGEEVYGAFHTINVKTLRWGILSEIDEREATESLRSVVKKMLYTGLIAVILASIASYLLSSKITQPLILMKKILEQMAQGIIPYHKIESKAKNEVGSMFTALNHLLDSIKEVSRFANEIGNQNLNTTYTLKSKEDTLGIALLQMRDHLIEVRKKELAYQKESKKSIIEGQENERQRLSKELHDGLGPLLTSLKHLIQSTAIIDSEKSEIKDLIDHTINEVRRITRDLMPSTLIDFGVGTSIKTLTDLISKSNNIKINFDDDSNLEFTPPKEIDIAIYRIVQEALNNTLKHAEATEINISFTNFEDWVSLFYRDNGKGFDEIIYGNGIINMKERAYALNGTFEIESSTNGTKIEVEIPRENHD